MYKVMSISIQLNDIVGVNRKDNPYLVEYIDDSRITLINKTQTLTREIRNGAITQNEDFIIDSLCILSRTGGGYAEFNQFVMGKWVNLKMASFQGNAQITNTDKNTDLIELTFEFGLVVFVDFEYKGLPRYIESITLTDPPDKADDSDDDDIQYGDTVEVPDHQQRYSLADQTSDMQKDLMSDPEAKLYDIQKTIQRYTELRKMYSLYDRTHIVGEKYFGENFCPMVDYVMENNYVGWFIPTLSVNRAIYSEEEDFISPRTEDGMITSMATAEKPNKNAQMGWVSPFLRLDVSPSANIINDKKDVANTMLGFAYTFGKKRNKTKKDTNVHVLIHDEDISDPIDIEHYNLLPRETVEYYKVALPGTNMVTKCNLNTDSAAYWRSFNRFRLDKDEDLKDMQQAYSHDNYLAYIRAVLPSTISVLNDSTDKKIVSFTRVLDLLQPYKVDRRHISKESFKCIRGLLKDNNKYFNCEFKANRYAFKGLLLNFGRFKTDAPPSMLHQMIRQSEFKGDMEEYYNLKTTSSESMNNMIRYDGAKVFMTVLALMSAYTYSFTPEELPDITTNVECDQYNSKENKHYDSKEDLKDEGVEDGDCAIVRSLPPTYFRREKKNGKSKWVQRELSDMKPSDPTCNVEPSCITASTQCDSMENTKFKLKKTMMADMATEFENMRAVLDEERQRTLADTLTYLMGRLPVIKRTRLIQEMKYNNYYTRIASLLKDVNGSEESPYAHLRDAVLRYEDFKTRQQAILKFKEKYTREPKPDESEHWLFCKKTSVKLLPRFKFQLAEVHADPLLYQQKLANIRQTGDEEGDNVVDRHSGYIICPVEYSTDEGYDASGRKNKSRDLVDKEYIVKKTKVEIQISKLKNFMNQIGIKLQDTERDHIIACIKNVTFDEEELYFMAGYLLSYIQIKRLSTTTTISNCKNITKPFTRDETVKYEEAVKYMACAMQAIFKSELRRYIPEDLDKTAVDKYVVAQLKATMLGIALQDTAMVAPTSVETPEAPFKLQWKTFLPPLQDIVVSFDATLSPLAEASELILSGKITMASMAIIQGVQKIINSFVTPALKSASYTKNFCCSEMPGVYDGFLKKNKDIAALNAIVRNLSGTIENLRLKSTPYYLFDKTETFKTLSTVSDAFSNKIIYKGYIELCKYNKELKVCEVALDDTKPMDAQIAELNLKVDISAFKHALETVHRKAMIPDNLVYGVVDPIDDPRIESANELVKTIKKLILEIKSKQHNATILQFVDNVTSLVDDLKTAHLSPSDIYLLVDFVKHVSYIFPEMVKNNINDRTKTQMIPVNLPPKHKPFLVEVINAYYEPLSTLATDIYTRNRINVSDNYYFLKDILLSHDNTGLYLYVTLLELFHEIIFKSEKLSESLKIIESFIQIFDKDRKFAQFTEEALLIKIRAIARKERKTFTERAANMTDREREIDQMQKTLKIGFWGQGLEGLSEAVQEEGVEEVQTREEDVEGDSDGGDSEGGEGNDGDDGNQDEDFP